MKQINYKKLILPNIPYVFFVYLFDKVGQAVRLAPGADISAKILNITQGFSAAFESALPSIYPLDLLVGIVGAVIIRLIVYVKGKNAKKYRKGAEYGSARWGNAEDIKPYIDPEFQNNIILTQTERLTMNSRPKQPKYARNKNVVVIGGSGSGKTRFFVKPNLMQLHSSYVLTDPKGTVLIECGKLLQRAGYRIKVLNTINFKKSMHYNPFVYQVDEKDLLQLMEDEQTEAPACSCTEKCVAGSVNTDCPVCSVNMSECAGKEAEPEPEETEQPEPEEDKGGGMGGAILLVVLLLAAVSGGAFYYFKIMKPKKDAAKGSSNLDDLDFDEDDEEELETEQEDEEV